MSSFTRIDRSIVGRWWWTVDRWNLVAVMLVIAIGILLILAAGPPAAERIPLPSFHFVERQFMMLPLAIALMLGVSMLSPRGVRRLALLMFVGGLAASAATLVIGEEIKGAQRWINVAGFSLQPTEFLKPGFAVVAAWLFAKAQSTAGFPGRSICIALFGLTMTVILSQPDLGMAAVVGAVWFGQFFLAGLPLLLVGLLIIGAVGALVGAYYGFDHVSSRIDRFLDPDSGDTYQIDRSLAAFENGGIFGRGPGEGRIKDQLPDAHSDFVFAVAGEEYGLLFCLLVVGLFALIVLRGYSRVMQSQSLFILLAAAGLFTQYGLQALINMASALKLMPTKGMTLPFISYGGSSLFAIAIGMGMALALTRLWTDDGDGL
ncbi:MAG: putative peptidoglycan glycosyltransferase FtsW [Alphaproteobacteria bacterium]